MPTMNVTLTPAEAAAVVERVIAIAESRYGYGEQAKEIITEAITEVKNLSGGTATQEPGDTTLTVESPVEDEIDRQDAEPATIAVEVPTLEERVSVLERIARNNGLLA